VFFCISIFSTINDGLATVDYVIIYNDEFAKINSLKRYFFQKIGFGL